MLKTFLKLNFVVIIALIFISPAQVFAHILQTDGSIGAVLHVNPEDDPIAGEVSNLYFDLKDKTQKFSIQSCDCKLTILSDNRVIHTEHLNHISGTQLSFDYIFPEKNVYKLKLSGTPLQNKSFQSFNLEYDVRVARSVTKEAEPREESDHSSLIVLWVIIGTLVFLISAVIYKKSYVNKPKK